MVYVFLLRTVQTRSMFVPDISSEIYFFEIPISMDSNYSSSSLYMSHALYVTLRKIQKSGKSFWLYVTRIICHFWISKSTNIPCICHIYMSPRNIESNLYVYLYVTLTKNIIKMWQENANKFPNLQIQTIHYIFSY